MKRAAERTSKQKYNAAYAYVRAHYREFGHYPSVGMTFAFIDCSPMIASSAIASLHQRNSSKNGSRVIFGPVLPE